MPSEAYLDFKEQPGSYQLYQHSNDLVEAGLFGTVKHNFLFKLLFDIFDRTVINFDSDVYPIRYFEFSMHAIHLLLQQFVDHILLL